MMLQIGENGTELSNDDCKIRAYMEGVLRHYDSIRGQYKQDMNYEFWDAVVLSASDESQKRIYESQITRKQELLELPLGIPFHVFSDPVGYKIGCGGSAMFVLAKLQEMYGEMLNQMHILFVPAGGYSQRLPSHSVLGKLFIPLPIRPPAYQMIDLILAVYLPFLKKMRPGIFLASSDAIISFSLEEQGCWSFENAGFTALAHPSTIAVGMHHGVYVLPPHYCDGDTAFMTHCIQVLQKPSKSQMRQKGAVIRQFELGEENETVFTDSAFFFDMDVASKLVNFFKKVEPLEFEISSYGDFLQPLGVAANPSYIQDKSQEVFTLRMELYEVLKGTQLHVIGLEKSSFFHFGTMREYIENFCGKNKFNQHFPCTGQICSTFSPNKSPSNFSGTVLFSVLHSESQVSHSSVVEYCDFSVPVRVSENCILSNCKLSTSGMLRVPVKIPAGFLIHTVAVTSGYATVCFSLDENIKKSCELHEAMKLPFLNTDLQTLSTVFPDRSFFSDNCETVSLWEAQLFPVCPSMEESFSQTLLLLYSLLEQSECEKPFSNYRYPFISMAEILRSKCDEDMLTYRRKLHTKAANSTHSTF